MEQRPSANLDALLRQKERETNEEVAELKCVFCKNVLSGRRKVLFDHFFQVHHFSCGRPDGLVYIDDFLELLYRRLHVDHSCLRCDKRFPSYDHVRLHMRKKGHLQINPNSSDFDPFYLANYLAGKRAPQEKIQQKEEEGEEEDDDDDDDDDNDGDDDDDTSNAWESWTENGTNDAQCLICPSRFQGGPPDCLDHMKSQHGLDMMQIISDWKLDFFARIRLINYLRRRVAEDGAFKWQSVQKEDFSNLQYLFSTLEDDEMLLYEYESNGGVEEEERAEAIESARLDPEPEGLSELQELLKKESIV